MWVQGATIAALLSLSSLASTSEAKVSAKVKADFAAKMISIAKERKLVEHENERKRNLRNRLLANAVPAPVRRLEDGAEEEEEEEEEEVDYGAFNFDASLYSLKYSGCHTISQVTLGEEGQEAENQSFYSTKRFVTFRLCPSDTCADNSFYGCKKNYGEYMILMDDYLEAMTEYKEKVFEYYCNYCEQCMYFEKYFYGNRKLDDAEAEAAGDDQQLDADQEELYEEYYQADDDNHACKYYHQCENYLDACDADAAQQNKDDDQEAQEDDYYQDFEYQQLFQCEKFNNGDDDGSAVYVGPHCASDSVTISIGLFSDEFCTELISTNLGDVVKTTKFKIDESQLSEYYSDSCIPCKESDIPMNVAMEDREDEDDINEVCERLYEDSAKCQTNLKDGDGNYGNLAFSSSESDVCEYIYNVVTKQYDSSGFLYMNQLRSTVENLSGNVVKAYYSSMDGEVSTSQIFGLLFGVVGCLVLSVWSCFLKRSIDKAQPNLVFNTKGEFNHGHANTSTTENEIRSSLSEAREAASTPPNTSKPAPAIVPDWSTLSPQAGSTSA